MSPITEGGRLGRYQILRMLGAGAMGEVFLAEDPQIGRRVAIKTVKIEDGRPNEMAERKRRLERESRAAGKLLHPNVVALFDVGEDQGVLYLAFECVEGCDLAQRLEVDPPLTLREAIHFVRQAAEGLDYAHRQGVVHRDIKPSNLLISAATGTIKVSDFGIAKLKDQTSDLTMTGSVVGSPHYLSPEQIRGDELDGRSDIFSLGVLFYEVLSRRRPFQGETLTTLVYQILHRDPPSIVVDRPELGTRLEGVLQRMLQKDRDERYKTAAEVARDLAICEQEIPASILDGPAAKDAAAPTESTRRMSTSERAVQVTSGALAPAPPPPPPQPLSFTQAPTEMLTSPVPPRPLVSAAGPAAAATAAGASRGASRTGLWLAGGAVALLILALVVGGLATRRWVAAKQTAKEAQQVASTPGTEVVKPAAAKPAAAEPVTPADSRPATTTTPGDAATQSDPGERFHQPTPPPPVAEPKPAAPANQPVPTPPVRPATVPKAEPAVAEPEPVPADASEEVSEPVVDRPGIAPQIDRMMVTGMALSFVVDPPEAIVKIDGRVIGQAGTWNAKKRDGRAYDLPESGDHIVRISHEGRLWTIRVSASSDAPSPTLVSADLRAPSAKGKKRRLGERPLTARVPLHPAEAALWRASPLSHAVRGLASAGNVQRQRLASGLEVCLITNRQAPIVTTVLLYRVGGRDETAGRSGAAHFLEHMMFKGSANYGPGEIDRRTQAQGGSNNAFTSHDLTAYYFSFAADRWQEALAIERDRMTALTLDAAEVTSERQVILEELAMYRDEPWDALELAVQAELFPGHPYGVPVLGTEPDLAALDRESLAEFHQRFYRPANALLVVAGDIGPETAQRIEAEFAGLPSAAIARATVAGAPALDGARRLERRHGEVARIVLALPAPPPEHPDHPGLRLLATLLGGGRTSRLHRAFVDVGQLCLAASCGLAEAELAAHLACSFEVLPDGDEAEVERRLEDELAALRDQPVGDEELERGKQILVADWVFQQERIHQQAITAALALAHGDLEQPEKIVRRALEVDANALQDLARRYLDPRAGSVFGVSLPEDE